MPSAIEIVEGAAAICGARAIWEAAESSGGQAGVFESFELARLAARAAERDGSLPLLVVVRDADGAVRTLLPLRRSGYVGARIVQALSAPLGQTSDTVGAPLITADLDAIGRRLADRVGADLLLLRKVRADGAIYAALAGAGFCQGAGATAPYVDLARFGSFAAYEASFSSATRRNRRQRRRKLEESGGPLRFAVLMREAALPAVTRAVEWKRAWLAEQGLASPVMSGGPWQEALLSACAVPSARTSVLYAGERPIAVELGFLARGDYVSYLGAFDPEFASASVGQEQMLRTLEWAFAEGVRRYDLLAPASDYKRQWARGDTEVAVDDFAVPLSVVGRGIAEARRRVRPVARDLLLGLNPELRAAANRYGPKAGVVAAALGMAVALSLE